MLRVASSRLLPAQKQPDRLRFIYDSKGNVSAQPCVGALNRNDVGRRLTRNVRISSDQLVINFAARSPEVMRPLLGDESRRKRAVKLQCSLGLEQSIDARLPT